MHARPPEQTVSSVVQGLLRGAVKSCMPDADNEMCMLSAHAENTPVKLFVCGLSVFEQQCNHW